MKMGKRNYGLDIARVTAMLGIIILHILGQGGGLNSCRFGTPQYAVVWWVEICSYTSVDLFALLSGWLGIYKTKSSVFRVFELMATVFFYSVLITIGFGTARPDLMGGLKDVITGIVPALAGRYWYITCYIPLAVLQPYLNRMLLSLSLKQHKMLAALFAFLFSLIPSLASEDFFALSNGYSTFWLIIAYVIGACLKRMDTEKRIDLPLGLCLCGFVGASVALLLGDLLLGRIAGRNIAYFVAYTSPVTLLMGILCLLALKNVPVRKFQSGFASLAGKAFDVYIIHCHILIFDYVMKDRFTFIIEEFPLPMIPIAVVCLSILIYLALCIAGALREFLFKKLCIVRALKWVAGRVDNIIY